jgi:glycerol uptake facilitator protein
MHSIWFGEFMGTLVLVLLGNGVGAGVALRKSYAADSGWIVITTGWALGVLCGVMVAQAFGSPNANLNPAITLAGAIVTGDYAQLPVYWSAQLLGAMAGAVLVALHYAPHWRLTPDPAAKLGIFCTNAAVRSPLANIFSEMLGTAVLVVIAAAIFSHGVAMNGPAAGLGPWLVGSLVWGIGLSPSTPRAIWDRELSTRCCPFPARADRIGATRPSPSLATSPARCSRAYCCATRICESLRVSR